jgi:superoxide dismutase, Cu-Zn family
MLRTRYFLAVATLIAAASFAYAQDVKKAEANLKPTQGNQAAGTLTFQEKGGKVQVKGKLSGVPAGTHGFHIHEKGDCSAPDGASAGGHFNPDGKKHGAPTAPEHHIGDMGNLEVAANGKLNVNTTLSGVSLNGANSIVGKAVILHGGADDMTTQPTGNAGARIACGVIEKK